MILFLKKLVNACLKPFGIKLLRVNEEIIPPQKYQQLITEYESCFSELVLPELSTSERQVELMTRLTGTNVSCAMYIIGYLQKSLKFTGDVCEFGVAQGATSALLANEIRTTEKNIWLFDSFEGLPRPTEKDILMNDVLSLGTMDKYEGTMAYQAGQVNARLKEISFPSSRVKIVPGFIEETIKLPGLPDKICFAFVDFDFYSPISVALKYLDKHLAAGGFIIVHDYGYFSSGAKTAVDEFLAGYPKKYKMTLPHKFAGGFCILQKERD